MSGAVETCEISLLDQEHFEESISQQQSVDINSKITIGDSKNQKRSYPTKGIDKVFFWVNEAVEADVLLPDASQMLSEEILEIQKHTQPSNDKQPTKDRQQLFSIEKGDGFIKLNSNSEKPIAGKVGSPIAYSMIKKKLWNNPEMRRFHSELSGYGAETPQGSKARPKQLLNPEMVDRFVQEQVADKGGINTMLTTFDVEVLGPIEDAFNDLPKLYLSYAGEISSQKFKETLEIVIKAQFLTLPSGLFFLTHLYNNNHKLIALGSSTVRSKTQLANATKQTKQKYVPALFGAKEIVRRQKILSDIKRLIDRVARLMGNISFLEAAPKFKEGRLETYWNQDLELTPGSLVFNINPAVQRNKAEDHSVGFTAADSSSAEQADQTTTANPKMIVKEIDSLNNPQDLEVAMSFTTLSEKSLFTYEPDQEAPKGSSTTEFDLYEGFSADSNTIWMDSGSLESDSHLLLQDDFSHREFAENHQTNDFQSA